VFTARCELNILFRCNLGVRFNGVNADAFSNRFIKSLTTFLHLHCSPTNLSALQYRAKISNLPSP
jgi:hypothetical protein